MAEPESHPRPHPAKQVLGSILAGVAIVAITILVVTLKFGPTSVSEAENREDALKERIDVREERREAAQERREEAAEQGR
jgi:hypothetical protein